MPHVFLSYCHDDSDEVSRLHADLTAEGIEAWWDKDIPAGADWKFEIRAAMKRSDAILLCLSRRCLNRPQSGIYPEILDAIAAYRERRPGADFLIPVRLSECEIPGIEIDNTRTLDRLEFVDLFPPSRRKEGVRKILRSLKGEAPPPPAGSGVGRCPIVPKGLRSYDAHDADFFLELLPGPRDRDGLPESLRFWKERIEEADAAETFGVGLIYGPSGCGKSSLIRAGLLPRLAGHVTTVYVEATPDETEPRLLKGLHRKVPDLPSGLNLVQSLAALGTEPVVPEGRKILLVLDQFEQWLFAKRGKQNTELVTALRRYDGGRVQAVVLVRDDFWMATTRFLSDLKIDLVSGRNVAAVDLFDLRHATKVLTAFGRAFEKLPAGGLTGAQQAFLDRAVTALAQDGRVVSMRLSLFTEMVKGREWTPETLRAVGGAEGVEVAFLEETFSSPHSNPVHRRHQEAARAVLKALLPEGGTEIPAHARGSRREILDASGYGASPRDFDDLMRILEAEVRLITPIDLEGKDDATRPSAPDGRCYQLTHDYLVPALRKWLTRKQGETRRGRAELRVAERAELWNAKPENRHLPSAWEWVNIRLLTRPKDWTVGQRRMMRTAGPVLAVRGLVALLLLAGAVVMGMVIHAYGLVQQPRTADIDRVPDITAEMRGYRPWVVPALRTSFETAAEDSPAKLRTGLALLSFDDRPVEFLYGRLLHTPPAELLVICEMLREHQQPGRNARLWRVLEQPPPGEDRQRLRAAGALARFDAKNPRWQAVAGKVADDLVAVNVVDLVPWMNALGHVRHQLNRPLGSIFRVPGRPDSERALAATVLAEYVSDVAELTGLLLDADAKQFTILSPKVEARGEPALALLEAELAKNPAPAALQDTRDQLARRQANAAVALIRFGRPEAAWRLLVHSSDPTVRSDIVNRLHPLGVDPRTLAAKLKELGSRAVPVPAPGPSGMDAILFHPETSTRRALILALRDYQAEQLSPGERGGLVTTLIDLYRDDPDAGIHGAAEWALRRWEQGSALKAADAGLMKAKDRGDRRWFVNRQGQTMVVIEGPVVFVMEPRPEGPDHLPGAAPRRVRIPRRFAIATREVTVEQYKRFDPSLGTVTRKNPDAATNNETPDATADNLRRHSPDPGGPQLFVTWYAAAAYCNWLSEQEGLPQFYEPNENREFAEGMRLVKGSPGYRLPTEAEWIYACRAGAKTRLSYGRPDDLLDRYAWFYRNAEDRAWGGGLLKPNDLGLFDMHGNAWEWVLDPVRRPAPATEGETRVSEDDIESGPIGLEYRILRSGSFDNLPSRIHLTFRLDSSPKNGAYTFGFRLARSYPEE